ncbi:Crp/Fnr family transcriptional regulator [Desulfitobacterium hafniense]|uniref:Crp/Fnr family transcriptional regulator n=1 Tax=Desulfitobacterium hafniense TaxID=49338 RepID=A0A0W1JK20_DESHA|nr:Crp/Fnr family transcriptional regulator [Desulfitobacterium hafniense]KTE92057.1 Crp/Fnr family transcriptional regulator [Desulfitobacterium hafniense]
MKKQCAGNPFCDALDPETRAYLCEHSTLIVQMPKQMQSTDQGNPHLELIIKGVLFTFNLHEDGTQEFIHLIKKGDVLGTRQLFESLRIPEYNMMTLTEVHKCSIPLKVAETLYKENRVFAQALMENLLDMMNNLTRWVSMRSRNGTEKVQKVYELLQDLDTDMTMITQEDLALIAGVSRITVARAMKEIYKK